MTLHGADKPDWLTDLEARAEDAEAEVRELREVLVVAVVPLEVLNADNFNGARWMTDELRGMIERAVLTVRKALASPQQERETCAWCSGTGTERRETVGERACQHCGGNVSG